MIPKQARFIATDPDGVVFWYAEEPKLGLNETKDLTWLCKSHSDCGVVEVIKDYKDDFRNSLTGVSHVS